MILQLIVQIHVAFERQAFNRLSLCERRAAAVRMVLHAVSRERTVVLTVKIRIRLRHDNASFSLSAFRPGAVAVLSDTDNLSPDGQRTVLVEDLIVIRDINAIRVRNHGSAGADAHIPVFRRTSGRQCDIVQHVVQNRPGYGRAFNRSIRRLSLFDNLVIRCDIRFLSLNDDRVGHAYRL